MILKTPVLSHFDRSYGRGDEPWACSSVLGGLFAFLPGKIILHASTLPSPEAVKVHLDSDGVDYAIDEAEEGTGGAFLYPPLEPFRTRFLEAGYTTIYVSMIDCG